jgi:peroxiredoxin
LADYQARMNEFRDLDVSIAALSVDPLDKARELVEQNHLEFPIAWGLKVPEDAERITAWWDEKRPMIQPSEFILGPSRKIVSATYSTGPIGRLRADDAANLIRFIGAQKK